MHPDVETLVRYRGGELTRARRAEIAVHLRRCDACGLEYDRLRAALAGEPGTAREGASLLDAAMLAAVVVGIQGWESAAAANPAWSGDALKSRVAARIGPYLGARAAAGILQPVSETGEDLLSTIEPVLALFLGARAASRLVTSVVDAAIVRI